MKRDRSNICTNGLVDLSLIAQMVDLSLIGFYRDKVFSQNGLHLLQLILVDIDSSYACVEVHKACADGAPQTWCIVLSRGY